MLVRIQSSALKFEMPVRTTSLNPKRLKLTLRSNDFVLTRRIRKGAASRFAFPHRLLRRATSCATKLLEIPFFESMSKRRRGFPSETKVQTRNRIVHGDKLLEGKTRAKRSVSLWYGKLFKRCCLHSVAFMASTATSTFREKD